MTKKQKIELRADLCAALRVIGKKVPLEPGDRPTLPPRPAGAVGPRIRHIRSHPITFVPRHAPRIAPKRGRTPDPPF
jgi:hypothetical protein